MPHHYKHPDLFPARIHRLWERLEKADLAVSEIMTEAEARKFQLQFRHFRFCLRQTPQHPKAAYEKAFAPRLTMLETPKGFQLELRPRASLLFLAGLEA